MSWGSGRGWGRLAVALACIAGSTAVAAPGAAGAVYWTGAGIGAANLDGSAPNEKYFSPPFLSDSAGPECGLSLSDTHLYWAGAFALGRVNLEGPATPVTISPHLQQPCGAAIDGAHVYWAEKAAGKIGRANLDGGEANTTLLAGLESPCTVAVDASYLYWVDWQGIGRARLDGSRPEPGFIPLAPSGCGLAVDPNYIYFSGYVPSSSQNAIGRATLDGVHREDDFIPGLEEIRDIAVDGGHVYWVDRRNGMYFASIGRASLDGSDVNRSWIPTQSFSVAAVAVDGRPSPPPLPLPSQPFHIGLVRHNLKFGTAVVNVSVPHRGELVLTSPAIGWKVLKGPEPPPALEGSFLWRLKLWPGRTRFGRKIRIRLRKTGHAPLNLHLSYAEEGQLPVTAEKRLSLLQHRKSAHKK